MIGDLTYSNTMTHSSTSTIALYNGVTSVTQNITSNGVTVDAPIQIGQRSAATTAATGDGTTATLTFATSTNYYFPVGSTIQVAGITPTGYNGTYTVTASTLTSVSYLNSTTAAQTVAGYVIAPGTVRLKDALTMGSTRTFSMAYGNLDIGNNNLSCGLFSIGTVSFVRTFTTTGGAIYLTGSNATLISGGDSNLTVNGTWNVYATYSGSTGTRQFTGTGSANSAFNLYVTGGTDTSNLATNRWYKTVSFTGFGGILGLTGSAGNAAITGDFIGPSVAGATTTPSTTFYLQFTNGGTNYFTTNGVTYTFPIKMEKGSGTLILNDDLSMDSTSSFQLLNGTFNFNDKTVTCGNFLSNTSATRAFNFGTSGKMVVTGNDATVFNAATYTNFSTTGTSRIELNYSGSVGTRTIDPGYTGISQTNVLNFYITGGTDIISIPDSRYIKTLDFTGFSGTLAQMSSLKFYGDLKFSPTMTMNSNTASIVAQADTTTQTITMSGKTLDMQIQFSGSNSNFIFADAFTQNSAKTFTFNATQNSTLTFASSETHTVGSFVVSGTLMKYIRSTTPGTRAFLSQASGTIYVKYLDIQDSYGTGGAVWDAINPSNVNSGNNLGWGFSSSNPFVFFY
jgi:hypothetical protein